MTALSILAADMRARLNRGRRLTHDERYRLRKALGIYNERLVWMHKFDSHTDEELVQKAEDFVALQITKLLTK